MISRSCAVSASKHTRVRDRSKPRTCRALSIDRRLAQALRSPTTRAQLTRESTPSRRLATGMRDAIERDMAAVLALIMLPLIASIGCFVEMLHGATPAVVAATLVFALLASFVLFSAFRVMRDSEAPTA
jgi:hypothetical protein